jgi:hypothetical protein
LLVGSVVGLPLRCIRLGSAVAGPLDFVPSLAFPVGRRGVEVLDERVQNPTEFLPAGRTQHDGSLCVLGRVGLGRDDGIGLEGILDGPTEVTVLELGHTGTDTPDPQNASQATVVPVNLRDQ